MGLSDWILRQCLATTEEAFQKIVGHFYKCSITDINFTLTGCCDFMMMDLNRHADFS